MARKKLKEWVLPVLGVFVLIGSIFCYYLISNIINYSVTEPSYVTDALVENTINVNEEIEVIEELKIIKPFDNSSVAISKYFYNKNDEESKQQSSLIRYENIYMPNTGVLYSADAEFNIIACLDGKVSSVKEDNILGNIIEIEHDNGLVTVYQSVKDVKVVAGSSVKQGDIIALSGANKLENEKENCLHFEVYQNGNLINPEEFYNLDLNTLS